MLTVVPVLIATVVLFEARTSEIEARLLSSIAAKLSYSVQPGPSPTISFPDGGPFNEQRGYAGLPEFQASGWYALFAPKGTPKPVLDTLTAALDKALDDPAVRKRFAELACDIPDKSKRGQAQLAAFVKSEIARWTPIIKAANIQVE